MYAGERLSICRKVSQAGRPGCPDRATENSTSMSARILAVKCFKLIHSLTHQLVCLHSE